MAASTGFGEPETGHVRHVKRHVEAGLLRPLAQVLDVLGGEIEPRHPVAALAEPDQVRPGAARDVEHGLDGPPRIAAEAVDEEVHLLLPVHVEGDLVVAGRRVLAARRHFAHQVRIASRRTQDAVMAVRPDGSKPSATSIEIRSHDPAGREQPDDLDQLGGPEPAWLGSSRAGRLGRVEHVDVDRHVERMPAELGYQAPHRLHRVDGVGGIEMGRLPLELLAGAGAHPHLIDRLGRHDVHDAGHGRGVVEPLAQEFLAEVGMGVELEDAQLGDVPGARTSITGSVAVWSPPSMTGRRSGRQKPAISARARSSCSRGEPARAGSRRCPRSPGLRDPGRGTASRSRSSRRRSGGSRGP